ncbi:MAG: hypothetical protein PWQ06_1657 [Anaerophaga sp.]|nr:hypothetical protein [Anaerophaga sp.]
MNPIATYSKMPEGKTPALTIFDLVQIDPTKENFYTYKVPTIFVAGVHGVYEYPVEIIESDEFQITEMLKKVLIWK